MKGIVGIEAAIVLIAFVIVAAALAFVVLNMGMYTTQRSKDVMQQGLNEASSALEVDGSVLGYVNGNSTVDTIYIPLKISPGQLAVDFAKGKLDVVITIPGGTFGRINSEADPERPDSYNYTALGESINVTTAPKAAVYIVTGDNDTVLEVGEKFLLVIKLPSDLALSQYEKFTVEIRPLQGAPLVVERTIPPTLTAGELVSLG
ncbi:MAG: archaellin/type IV pilin N-terminal domain-containing protein [Thermoprotei archaeon]